MKIVFAVTHFGFLRNFEHGLAELGRRGHTIHFVTDRKERLGGARTLENLEHAAPGAFTWELAPSPKQHAPHVLATSLRLSLDYWRYLEPAYATATALRERAATQVPPAAVRVGHSWPFSLPPVRRMTARLFKALERAVPPPPQMEEILRRQSPDLLMVTPLLYFGSPQVDYVRAARQLGIPSVLCIGSWDHLTTKGLIHETPDAVTVWNESQRKEAAALHGIPAEIVSVTGAQAYDHWFGKRPSISREEFLRPMGLPPDGNVLLYLCSSPFITPYEVGFVRRWLEGIRASGTAGLNAISVIVRPHPQHAEQWNDVDLSALGPVAIWPRAGANPVDDEARADYFHSMYFSIAVVGVNTSALIESGIVGRPVYSLQAAEFAGTQEGTLHFQHLKKVSGGLLTIADSLDAHVKQLGELAADPVKAQGRGRAFIEAFIRPRGFDTPATPVFADAVEEAARKNVPSIAVPWTSGLLRPAVTALVPVATWARRRQRARKAETDERPAGKLRLLFVMGSPEYLRFYDETLKELAVRGHDVCVGVNAVKEAKQARFRDDALGAAGVRFVGVVPARDALWAGFARAVRGTMDFVRYLDPRFADAKVLRARMKRKALPWTLQWVDRIRQLPAPVVRSVLRGLSVLERAIPISRRTSRFIEDVQPDAVLVSPLVDAASDQVDVVRCAQTAGLPAIACIASWDNLTNKGLLRVIPDRVTVWNEHQKREAVDLHGVPPDRVVLTGAQAFDRWFGRQPSRSREEFCRMVGLAPHRPFVLFTGSSFFISGEHTEVPFVRRWIEDLRRAPRQEVGEAGVLIRPHPYNADQWAHADLQDLPNVAIWPRGRHDATNEPNRDDFFDSIYHSAAVVGVNTSAMVEATIVGRPVHALVSGDFDATQEGTLHFRYLLPENGGFLQVARRTPEHLEQLARSLESPALEPLEKFVASFIRPWGTDRRCVPILADAIEEGARLRPARQRAGVVALAARIVLVAPLLVSSGMRQLLGQSSGGSWKQARKNARMFVHHGRKRLSRTAKELPKAARRITKAGRRVGRALSGLR